MAQQQKTHQLPPLRKILIIGNGGRENSIAWALAKDKEIESVFVAPGNGGTETHIGCKALNIKVEDHNLLIQESLLLQIDLIIIGPEAPLAAGLADKLREAGLVVFGPSAKGAQLEASKSWAKSLMSKGGIPTAKFWAVNSEQEALRIVKQSQRPFVVKANGLASGKGVFVCKNINETKRAIHEIFEGKFGIAGETILLEEILSGPEVSIFALCDGKKMITLPPAQDHKRLLNNDEGPNTGGMGAYAPAPLITSEQLIKIKEKILKPTLNELIKEGINYRGVIYAGLMMTSSGPKVIEFNCRFGDPECQALMPLMGDELGRNLQACALGLLEKAPTLTIKNQCSACVVASAHGYPEKPREGDSIKINHEDNQNIQIFHAGTKSNSNNDLTCSGGRVLCVTAQGENFEETFNLAYKGMNQIYFKGMHYRSDIGYQVRRIHENKKNQK